MNHREDVIAWLREQCDHDGVIDGDCLACSAIDMMYRTPKPRRITCTHSLSLPGGDHLHCDEDKGHDPPHIHRVGHDLVVGWWKP